MYRPRGALARTLYDKIQNDERLRAMDKEQWYCVNEERIKSLSTEAWRKFQPFEMDEETQLFLDNCVENSDNLCWQLWLTIANSVLSWFLTSTSINGLLGRGSMQVFSSAQFQQLINWNADGPLYNSLLDIGAGDGYTTDRMKKYFAEVYVTEMSQPMKNSLTKKGYKVLNESFWNENTLFDVVSCLNVLDRCDMPISLLQNIQKVLRPDGIAVVAFVIPFKPYVEFGQDPKNHTPFELLPIKGKNFEEEVVNFIDKVLTPNGWAVIRWTKLPYVCEGDIHQAYYWLKDVVFVIRRA